jgi:Domain of unknown function (DUF4193)
MAEEELDEDVIDDEGEVPEDLDEEDLEDLDDAGDADDDDDEAILDEEDEAEAVPAAKAREDDDDDDDDDEEDSDDVEASLDVILKERLVVNDEEADDEEDLPDSEDRGEATPKVLPKQPGEFVCQSCFLVKHPSQLADKDRMFCRDCV